MTRILLVLMFGLLAGCAGGGSDRSASKDDESSSLISDLQGARLEATTISARKLIFDKVTGTVGKGATEIHYSAYYKGDVPRLVEETADYGASGESESGYFLDSHGRFFYYTASHERRKQSNEQTIRVRIAFDESGNVVGSEKSVNGEAASVSDREVRVVKSRLRALIKAADASKKPS